ncbi:MAG: SGNH/GDSL hydrolase family protein [Ferruginibacter sp.]
MNTTQSFLALGDSYTIGQSVTASERFPEITVSLLNASGKKIQPPRIIATTGWTTRDLLNALNNNPGTFDIVTLLIGVNNQYQGKSQDEYRSQFTTLLLKAIQYAGNRKNRVFVLSIPDYSVTPFAQGSDVAKIAREIDQFNAINKEISLSNGVNYLDITPISREGKTDGSLQAGDGLHPSGKQYLRWAQLLAPIIAQQL